MVFCANCGASVEGKFCARCGTSVGTAPTQAAEPQGAPYTAPVASASGMTDNVAAALCYVLGLITGIVFLVLAPYNQNKFIRFHAFQAIFFHVAFIVLTLAEMMIGLMMPIGMLVMMSLLSTLIWLGAVVVWILLLVKAYQGERFKLPIIGDLAEKQA